MAKGKLTKQQVRDIYFHNIYEIGEGTSTLARRYNASINTIYKIRDGRDFYYRHWTKEFEAERGDSDLQPGQPFGIRSVLSGESDS